jgi:hypothetical protein
MTACETRETRIESGLDAWYAAHQTERQRIESIASGADPVSLRMLDWFVTNFAKTSRVVYVVDRDSDRSHVVDVHAAYKSALATFHKHMFDPFRRTGAPRNAPTPPPKTSTAEPRHPCPRKTGMRLSVRQKNFFRWAVEHGVLGYVTAHVPEIECDMSARRQRRRAAKRTRIENPAADEACPEEQSAIGASARQTLATIVSQCSSTFTLPSMAPVPAALYAPFAGAGGGSGGVGRGTSLAAEHASAVPASAKKYTV